MPYFRVPSPIGRTYGKLHDVGDGTHEFEFNDILKRAGLGFLMGEVALKNNDGGVERETLSRGRLYIEPKGFGSGTIRVSVRSVFGNTYRGVVNYTSSHDSGEPITNLKVDVYNGISKFCEDGQFVSGRARDLTRFRDVARAIIFDNWDTLKRGLPAGIFEAECKF
jgi:hypothetical protein